MDRQKAVDRLAGCYITIPTMFRDPDLELDTAATRRVVRFILDGGFREGYGVLLAGGAAGDFSTMTFDERVRNAEAIVEEVDGKMPVVMGAQTTSTRELIELARAAKRIGADYIQVSRPYYFHHTDDDFLEFVTAATEAADIGIVLYNIYFITTGVSLAAAEQLTKIPSVVGLKWSTQRADDFEYESVVSRFAERCCVIDNQNQFAVSHMIGARGVEVHMCNFWPEWGVRLIDLLRAGNYVEAERENIRVNLPFMKLWLKIESEYTSGDGYLDKLCMELVGLDSSRCRPPTRDVRDKYRDAARAMLIECGAPRVKRKSS
jgi:dihydrodipicolinate synthase/N-acetylneuraminate lyase